MFKQLFFTIFAALVVTVAANTPNPDKYGVWAMKKGQKVTTINVMWNQGYSKINSFAQFEHQWRYLCETIVAPAHEHHGDTVVKGKKPCTATVTCIGHETNGQDDNAVIKGGVTYDQTINTYNLGHSWGWLAYNYSNNVCQISAADWAKM